LNSFAFFRKVSTVAQAIETAKRFGLDMEAKRLTKRSNHCRQVNRKQFCGF
jgi:hypothetical protein